ncbi:MAG: winged helix DNA-binding protein [Rhodospirillaceae bacterium]|jgi:predicted MarR family transcription regulator|nr:winged helix DNA-binding protein [Rhodospirillaceae bacterium]
MSADKKKRGKSSIGPIVSSAHLAAEGASELSEFEFGLTLANNAFHRWIVRCMAAAGYPDLGALEVLILHTVNHRDRAKKLADICLVLNVEDTHVVNYALKKLVKLRLVDSTKSGKENLFATTDTGAETCERYREIRDQCLVETFTSFGGNAKQVSELAALMRMLSGLYDQAARAATSL